MSHPDATAAALASLRADRARFGALEAGSLDRPVPTCPDWSVRDLLVHLGRVHRWAMAATTTPPDGGRPAFPRRPESDPIPWVLEGLDQLLSRFSTADLTEPCWTFTGPSDVGWWLRRQTDETAVHRWDVQAAVGTADPVDPDVARVGIDEWCELQATHWFRPVPDLEVSVHLHATDGEGEWYIEASPEGLEWRHEHHKGDIAIRAERSELFLVMWRRLPPTDVEVFGDLDLVDRFLGAASVG